MTNGAKAPRRKLQRTNSCFCEHEEETLHTDAATKAVGIQTLGPELRFEDLTREMDVRFYTGFEGTAIFNMVFSWLLPEARIMKHWRGRVQTTVTDSSKRGPGRKLDIEQEFLLVMIKLRLNLFTGDLASRFRVSKSTVSRIFHTWICLLSRELSFLIIWPSKGDVRITLPKVFRKWFPRIRCVIDCTEIPTETPSALDIQASLWSDYKHDTTIKFLVSISPTGAITFVSKCYGGRASDKYIFTDSKVLDLIEADDQVLADRGFKITEELLLRRATLAIPPSVKTGIPLSHEESVKTTRIANTRIFVEKAIGRMKYYRILADVIPLKLLPLVDDIVVVCAALSNLRSQSQFFTNLPANQLSAI
ncbi:uncharacterized protein LOC141908365 [Tubulanus polymorphus]|uniref:uncharacterized protein LOC141908365 n=1 Tax=Tubulanus polymorphus TaxID=672921 RepID=UPI003DA65513